MCQTKKPITYTEQMNKLKERGCIVSDEDFCLQKLADINYYRLSAYFLPFRKKDKTYWSGTDFNKIICIYEFDRKLRNVLFSALEEVEVTLRARIAYYHSIRYGEVGYLDASNFSKNHDHERLEEELKREIKSNKNVPFVKHHIRNYGGVFPFWVVVELFSFGMLSRFYYDLPVEDRKSIAKEFKTNYRNMQSWLRCCTDLRNICAHYGRLYYRIFSAIPFGMSEYDLRCQRGLWGAIFALKSIYPSEKKWNCEIVPSIVALIDTYEESISLSHLAFPEDWEQKILK